MLLVTGVSQLTSNIVVVLLSCWQWQSRFIALIVAVLTSFVNKQNKQKLITPCELSDILCTKRR